jgi:hypothetical protein
MTADRHRRLQNLVVRMQQAFSRCPGPPLDGALGAAAVLHQRGHVRVGAEHAGGGRRSEQNVPRSVRPVVSAFGRTRGRLIDRRLAVSQNGCANTAMCPDDGVTRVRAPRPADRRRTTDQGAGRRNQSPKRGSPRSAFRRGSCGPKICSHAEFASDASVRRAMASSACPRPACTTAR